MMSHGESLCCVLSIGTLCDAGQSSGIGAVRD